jgi:hypothetical protein
LLGIYRPSDNCFRQIVFNRKLEHAAKNTNVGYPVIFNPDIESVLNELLNETRKNRPLIAFSEHEYNKINFLIGSRSIEKRYRNVRPIAKRYFKDTHPDKPVPNTLLKVAERLMLDTTDKVKDKTVVKRMKEVKKYGCSAVKWASAPNKAKKLWHEVLEHNKWDCMVMHKALLKMLKSRGSEKQD